MSQWWHKKVLTSKALDNGGVAAVEFALILPMLLLVYLGGAELIQGIEISRQVTLTSTTVANIVTQYTTISSTTQMPDILNASVQIIAPYSPSKAGIVVSLITIDSKGNGTIAWSQALHATARTVGQTFAVPAKLAVPNSSLVLSEATYSYSPTIDIIMMGTQTLAASIYMVPRQSSTINLT